jgi:hypothetical protein
MWIVQFSSECSSSSLGAAFTDGLNQLNTYRNIQRIYATGVKKKSVVLNQFPNVSMVWLF